MDIRQMTKKDFERLPYCEELADKQNIRHIDVDSIVLFPTRRVAEYLSEYKVFEVVVCSRFEPICRLMGYDSFSFFIEGEYTRVGIDCLRCGLIRIFLPQNEYVVDTLFHEIRRKTNDNLPR